MTASIPFRTRRWNRREYKQLNETGILPFDSRLELLGGELVIRERQSGSDVLAIELTTEALRKAFGLAWRIRTLLPIALADDSEPTPDLSCVAGRLRDASPELPAHAELVVEVSGSSLQLDREFKGSLYAKARVPEYWIVNLVDRVLEIHRTSVAEAAAPYGWAYQSVQTLRPDEYVTPLALPSARILIADLLP